MLKPEVRLAGGALVESEGTPPSRTDFRGNFRLYGVAGHARLRVSKPGYVTRELPLSISNHHTENVSLALAGPRSDFSGLYDMAIVAADSCRETIPAHLLTRRYRTAVVQSGNDSQITPSGARFNSGFPTGQLWRFRDP